MTETARTERARIVRWLRQQNAIMSAFTGPSIGPTKFGRTLERIADALERGEHLKKPEPSIPASEHMKQPNVGH